MRPLFGFLLCLAAPTVAAQAAELKTGSYQDWRYEIVSHIAPGGEKRVACSVATGPETTPTVLLSFAAPDMSTPGALSGFVYAENGAPVGAAPIGAAFEVDFEAGAVKAPGKVKIEAGFDETAAQSEAYPAQAETKRLLVAMRDAPSLRLVRDGDTLRDVPLDGFSEAYETASMACQYPAASHG